MKKFGFGQKTGIDLFEESAGVMPSKEWKMARYKKPWVQGDTIPVGIGQGYWIATPLQLAKATSVLINNGRVNTPHLMKEVMSAKAVEPYKDPALYEDITGVPERFWQVAKLGMYNVINAGNGTGKKAGGSFYRAAGKTGTAQVFNLKGGKYNKNALKKELHDHAWFMGYAPYDNPKVAVAIILENAGGGGSVAAPVARKVFDFALSNTLKNDGAQPLQKNEQIQPLETMPEGEVNE